MKIIHPSLAVIFALVFLAGCATSGSSNQYNRPLCAVAGAAVGGAAGKLIEDEPEGVAVGAIAGGLIAWFFCDDDEDGDGVSDADDSCRGTPRGTEVDSRGCPRDSDKDGVPDTQDQCPDTPRGARVDSNGCSIDSDGDGVADGLDRCPGTPKGAAVDSKGCELDSDGDGVYDSKDQCPGTPRGESVDARGCHTIVSMQGVNFALNSFQLTEQAKSELDMAVQLLKQNSGVEVQVQGHTDDSGAESYNLQLSQSRAEAVVDYLVMNGISRGRLTARGFGEASPVAGNDTKEGRERNRRVDLVRDN